MKRFLIIALLMGGIAAAVANGPQMHFVTRTFQRVAELLNNK